MFQFFVLSLLFVSFAIQNEAVAQCCAAGNPVNTNCATANDGAGILNVTYSYMYSFSDTYYKGTQPLDKTYAESYFDYSSLGLSYGLSDKLRITADIGYYFDKSQNFVGSDYTRFANGISDATLGINYSTYASENNLFEIQQTARVTLPVGKFDQEYDGIILPIDFQPSSGNYRYNIGVILSKRFEDSDFSLMSFNSVELSQAIETKNTYHKYGNLYNASLLGIYRISSSLLGLMQLRYEIRDRALTGTINSGSESPTENNRLSYLNASGGVIAYLSPQIALNFFDYWMLSFQYNYPIYKNIYGEEQLTNRHSIAVNISRALDFGSIFDSNDQPEMGNELLSTAMDVHGSCEMCKSRIETVASELKYVQSAKWDVEKQKLTVFYANEKPDFDGIEKALAAAGHDSGSHIAPDDVYNNLPACCHYR